MPINDIFLKLYFRACGGAPRNYARWLYQLGLSSPPAQRRYGPDALAVHTGQLAERLERASTPITADALARAEEGVARAARLLARCGYDTVLRRKRTSQLFYATARRDAIRMLLAERVPATQSSSPTSTPDKVCMQTSTARRRANLKYRLTIERRKEAAFAVAAAEATEVARAAHQTLDQLKAQLVLAKDRAQLTLADRRLRRAGARLPPGMRSELDALAAQVRNQRRIVAKLAPAAQAQRGRLARCRTQAAALDAALVAMIEKK